MITPLLQKTKLCAVYLVKQDQQTLKAQFGCKAGF
jgi:hypothetical protein